MVRIKSKRALLVCKISTFCLLLMFGLSCTKSVRVNPVEYEGLDPSEAKHWRVVTTYGHTYWVDNFQMTDSTVVILQASKFYGTQDMTEPVYLNAEDLPIVVSRNDLLGLDKRQISKGPTVAIIIGGLAVFVGFSILAATAGGWASSN